MRLLCFLKRSKGFALNAILAGVLAGGVYLLYRWAPVAYVYLISEDFWGEYATFVCYLIATFLLISAMKSNKTLVKPGYLILVGLFVFVLLEEISWGQRFFNIATPQIVKHYNAQGEITLHNLYFVSNLSRIMGGVILAWMAFSFVSENYPKVKNYVQKIGIPILPVHLWPLFWAPVFMFFVLRIPRVDESGELLLALAFLAYVLELARKSSEQMILSRCPHVVADIVLLVLISLCTGFLVYISPGDIKWRMNDMAASVYPAAGLPVQAEKIFDHIIRHPHLKTEESMLAYASFLCGQDRCREADEILVKALADNDQRLSRATDSSKLFLIRKNIEKAMLQPGHQNGGLRTDGSGNEHR